ncbi:MAG: DUF885 domain-containing protein [Pseudomonadota bacterium]
MQYLWDRPEELTYLGVLESLGITGHNARWNDASQNARRAEHDFKCDALATLDLYDPSTLKESEKLSVAVLREFLGDPDAEWRFRHHDYPVNQLVGVHLEMPEFLDTFHQVYTEEDAEHYVVRLMSMDGKLRQVLEGVAIRTGKGIIPPTFIIDKTTDLMTGFVETPIRNNILYTSFEAKLDESAAMPLSSRERLLAAAEEAIEVRVYPAYREFIGYFAALRDQSSVEAGVWKLPDGAAYYQHLLSVHTTTDLTADEIYRLGLSEVARIGREILELFAAEGYDTDIGIAELYRSLAQEARFRYPDTEAGRQQVLLDYATLISDIESGLGGHFNVLPGAELEVRRVPEFSETSAVSAYYWPPSQDGSRPGVFYANLYDVNRIPKFGMRTLAYHEGIPGHHLQNAIQVELEGLPEFRSAVGFTAYSEGWGLYAEYLAWEMGYLDDPYDNLGRLRDEMLRAVRLVVDPGIHAKRWTREEAIEYFINHTGWSREDAIVEIDRYIVDPGAATAYKVGMLEILRLRERARSRLGDAFDIREFHNLILGNGQLPLHTIEGLVNRFIERGTHRSSE